MGYCRAPLLVYSNDILICQVLNFISRHMFNFCIQKNLAYCPPPSGGQSLSEGSFVQNQLYFPLYTHVQCFIKKTTSQFRQL